MGYLFFNFPSTANNGNPSGQDFQYAAAQSLPAVTLHQTYGYDGLNRLSTVAETGPGPTWSQTFGYDNVGNRWVSGGLQIDQFTPTGNGYDGNNQMSGVQYGDGRGNVTQIGGYTYQYDAENRLIASTLASYGQVIASATYSYDGDGRRVMKQQSGGVTTHYVYDAQGNLVLENNLTIANVVDAKHSDVLGTVSAQAGTGGLTFNSDANTFQQATQVTIQSGLSGNTLEGVLVHEGAHVEDRANFVNSISHGGAPDFKLSFNPALNITGRQSEFNAYGVENTFLRSIGQAQRNIRDILAHPPYSDNPNIDKPLFVEIGKPQQ